MSGWIVSLKVGLDLFYAPEFTISLTHIIFLQAVDINK